MTVQGKVHSVETYPTGSQVVADYASGATVIQVGSSLDLQETGGTLTILGVNYTYTLDPLTSTITLGTGLTTAIDEGEAVLAYPPSEEKRVYAYIDDGEDAVIAVVPHALQGDLDEGIREEDERETVVLEEVRGAWMVKNIVALDPLSDARTRQALADAAAALIAAAAAQGTADSALISANGKNAVIHADYAPTNEPNTLYDTWFVHSTEPGEEGRIIGQYSGLGGTSWTPVQISHQVIASVDLGTATVGRLAANYIDTGVLSAALTVTGYLLAGNPEGARVVIDADGIRQYDADGNIIVNIPTDPTIPAQFEGTGIFNALTVKDNLSIQGLANEVARGAVVTVAGGTSAPLAAPSVAVGYQTYDTGRFGAGSLYIQAGTHADVDNSPDILGAATFYGYGKVFGRANKYWVGAEYTDSEGTKRSKYGNIGSSTVVAVGGSERIILNSIYTTGNGAVPVGRVTSLDPSTMTSSGTVAPLQKTQLNARKDDYIYYMRIGRVLGGLSGTQFPERIAMALVNYQAPNVVVGQITLRQYTVTDSSFAQVGSDLVIASPLASGETVIGVTHGRSDKLKMTSAGTDYTWLLHGSVKTYAYTTAGVRVPDYDFNTPAGAVKMMAHGDVVTNGFVGFRSTTWDDTSPLTKLTNNHWLTGTSGKWWVSSTNYDSDITGGTHETTQGPRASITVPKRAGIVITVPPYPARPFPTTTDDPLSSRIYIGRGSSDPGRTFMERAGELNSPARTLAVGDFTFPAGTAASPPPATSNFPASSPGKIVSSDGSSWILSGDNKATFAGVEFDGAQPGFKSTAMRIKDSGFAGSAQTTTSTAVVKHPNGPTITVTAPPSGVIAVLAQSFVKISAAPYFAFASVQCRVGNSGGTVVDTQRVLDNYNDWVRAGGVALFTGLTPGDTYFFCLMFATSNASGTASISQSRLVVVPSA